MVETDKYTYRFTKCVYKRPYILNNIRTMTMTMTEIFVPT